MLSPHEDFPQEGSVNCKVVHMVEIIDRHYNLLEATEQAISQLETKAYNMGDDLYNPNGQSDCTKDNPPQGYPAQYVYLLERQSAQLARIERVIGSLNNVI